MTGNINGKEGGGNDVQNKSIVQPVDLERGHWEEIL